MYYFLYSSNIFNRIIGVMSMTHCATIIHCVYSEYWVLSIVLNVDLQHPIIMIKSFGLRIKSIQTFH